MALVRGTGNANYRRFNWMGSDKSETSFENTQLMRDGGDTTRGAQYKRRTREQRTRVIREVRCYLDMIRKELLENDRDAEITGMPKSGYKREMSEEKEKEQHTMNLSCLVRGSRYRHGKGYTSPYDGTSHGSLQTLNDYNSYCRKALQDIVQEKKRDVTERRDNGYTVSQRDIDLLEEAESMVFPEEDELNLSPQQSEILSKPEGEAEEEKQAIHDEYQEKALGHAKEFLSFNLVRNANLYGSYRQEVLSRSQSRANFDQSQRSAADENQQQTSSTTTTGGGEGGSGENNRVDDEQPAEDQENSQLEQTQAGTSEQPAEEEQ